MFVCAELAMFTELCHSPTDSRSSRMVSLRQLSFLYQMFYRCLVVIDYSADNYS